MLKKNVEVDEFYIVLGNGIYQRNAMKGVDGIFAILPIEFINSTLILSADSKTFSIQTTQNNNRRLIGIQLKPNAQGTIESDDISSLLMQTQDKIGDYSLKASLYKSFKMHT